MSRRGLGTSEAALRVPYAAILPARHVAAIAFTFPLLAHLADTARLVVTREKEAAAVVVAIVMLLVRYGCARRAFSARLSPFALLWLIAGVLVSAGLELGYWLHSLRGAIPEQAFEATARANFLAGPAIQAAYGLVFMVIEMRFVAESSDESADQAVVAAALWLGLPWLSMADVGTSLILSRTSLAVQSAGARHLITTVPVALALLALSRLILRRRWVAIVSSERDPRWRLIECDGGVPPGLPSLAHTQPATPSMILVTVYPGEVPHRKAERIEPRATLCARREP